MTTLTLTSAPEQAIRQPGRLTLLLRYLKRNKGLAIRLTIMLLLVAFTAIVCGVVIFTIEIVERRFW